MGPSVELICEIVAQVLDGPEFAHRTELREEFRSVRCVVDGRGDDADLGPLWDFLKSHRDLSGEIAVESSRRVIDYVVGQCEAIGEVAKYRPLTEEDRMIGRELSKLVTIMQEWIRMSPSASSGEGAGNGRGPDAGPPHA